MHRLNMLRPLRTEGNKLLMKGCGPGKDLDRLQWAAAIGRCSSVGVSSPLLAFLAGNLGI